MKTSLENKDSTTQRERQESCETKSVESKMIEWLPLRIDVIQNMAVISSCLGRDQEALDLLWSVLDVYEDQVCMIWIFCQTRKSCNGIYNFSLFLCVFILSSNFLFIFFYLFD